MIRIILLLHKAYTKLKRINCWYDEELLTYLSNMWGTIKRMKNWTKTKQNWFKKESFRFDESFTYKKSYFKFLLNDNI